MRNNFILFFIIPIINVIILVIITIESSVPRQLTHAEINVNKGI